NPSRGADILDAIQAISVEGFRALSDPEIPRETLLTGLSNLIKQNHLLLKEIGVSHFSLEEICELTDEFGLSTKLTGAGGGGCAVTLIPDDFYADSLKILMDKLAEGGYNPYLTTVGGSGLGVLPITGDPTPEEKEELHQSFVDTPIALEHSRYHVTTLLSVLRSIVATCIQTFLPIPLMCDAEIKTH
ncbi:11298_t:CDS:2, partial [Acaulospora colombiana]